MRTLERRKSILLEIGHYLVKTEKLFFEGKEAHLKPLARREMALALNLSESTIARALQGKYVQTPRGLFALQDFFPYALHSDAGPISNASAKELLVKLIEEENKERPFSDQDLSQLLEAKGIPCARRTVAKYRNELCIGSKHKRKKWC